MKWEYYEELFLLELYETTRTCSAEEEIKILELSRLLNERAKLLNIKTNESFRNAMGIKLKLLNIEYIATNGFSGLKNYSSLDLKVYNLFINNHEKYLSDLSDAKKQLEELRKKHNKKKYYKKLGKKNSFTDRNTPFYTIYNIPLDAVTDYKLNKSHFSNRTYNCLKSNNINSLFKLLNSNYNTLSNIKNMGLKSLEEVISFVKGIEFDSDETNLNNIHISKAIKCKSQQILDKDFSFLNKIDNEEDIEVLRKYQEAVLVVDDNLAKACVFNTNSVLPLIKSLQNFANKQMAIDNRKRHLYECVNELPKSRQEVSFWKLFKIFEKEYLVSDELKKALQKNDLKMCYYINTIDLNNHKLYNIILNFLQWCKYSITDSINNYFDTKILNDEKTVFVLKERAKGTTLESIGNKLNLTRERVRQIESKARKKFETWQNNECSLLKIAIDKEKDALSSSDLSYFFGENYLIAFYLLKEIKSSDYKYDSAFNVFYIGNEEVFNTIRNYIDRLPNLFSLEEVNIFISNARKEGIDAELFKIALNSTYKISGNYYRLNKISRNEMCSIILKKYYAKGIHVYDDLEIDEFCRLLVKEFGTQDFSNSKRAIVARIVSSGILCGRGVYKPKQETYISKTLLEKIVDYIENSDQTVFMTNSIYHLFSDDLINEGIDNKYYLQGVLHELLKDKYVFRRDYISKDESLTSYSTEIIKFIKTSNYPVSKERIYEKFPGITDIVINLAIQDKNIINYFGQYLHVCHLNIQDEDIFELKRIVNEFLNHENCVHIKSIYATLKNKSKGLLKRLYIEDSFGLFSVIEYIFDNQYIFKRPYIANLGTNISKSKDIIAEYVRAEGIVNIDDLLDFSRELYYHAFSILELINSLNDVCLLISSKKIAKIDYIGVSKETCNKIEKVIEREVKETVCIRDLISIFELAKINVPWTDWLIYSIINKWSEKYDVGTSSNQFRNAIPLIAPKGKLELSGFLKTNSKPSDFKIEVNDINDLNSLELELFDEDFSYEF